jgi:hypothetical protein
MTVLFIMLYVLSAGMIANGVVLIAHTRKLRTSDGCEVVEATVCEVRRYDKSENLPGMRQSGFYPVFELEHMGSARHFMGRVSRNGSRWLPGQTVKLLYTPEKGTAVEYDSVALSRITGIVFVVLGCILAAGAALAQILTPR